MSTTETARIEPAGGLAWLLFGGLWPCLVLWDWASGADLIARLSTMPLSVVAMLLVLCVLGYLAARERGMPAQKASWPLAFAIFGTGMAVLITAFRAHDPVFGLVKLSELALVAGAALSLAVLFRERKCDPAACLYAMVSGTALAVLILGALHATGSLDHLVRLSLPGFVHIRIFGFTLALMIAGGAGLWIVTRGQARIILAISLVLLWTALFWSGGRGALLSVVAGTLLTAAVLPALRPAILPLIATGLAGFLCALAIPAEGADLGLLGRMEAAVAATSADALSSGRLEMWQAAWAATLERPWAGHGYAQAHFMFREAGFQTAHLHTHSIILDATLAFGLPLAGLLAAFVLGGWGLGLKAARASGAPLAGAGCAIVTVFLAHALLDGIYFYAQGLVPLALGAALMRAGR